jgi:hypothetical protein
MDKGNEEIGNKTTNTHNNQKKTPIHWIEKKSFASIIRQQTKDK